MQKNLLVLASAGSGKTYRLSDRIIGLAARGVEPEKIVALTFTRKAAGEFAEAILTKLAGAAEDTAKAAELGRSIAMPDADFPALLEAVVRKLPKLTLGTMDGFFARVVKGFQYELGVTGGRFDLLEGEVAEGVRDELMESLLDGGLDAGAEDEFVEIFRRATAGEEGARVLEDLRDFIGIWHRVFVSPDKREWGPAWLVDASESDWEKQKGPLIEQLRRDWPNVPDKKKRHETAFEPMLAAFTDHTIGSGVLGSASGLVPKILEAACEGGGSISISYYQPLVITGPAAEALRKLVELAAACEFAAALSRTRGIRDVIGSYDAMVDRELRSRGRLGFDDVKRLMGAWMKDEDARLRREAVDFRLDANYSHWLLDEFQDTSRDEWNALLPLIDEGLTDDESTVFVVGDKKQAIYAWRGGEVGLFDELIENYSSGLEIETMAKSWRSCPEVLGLVNRICGDRGTMSELFGEAEKDWEWEKHVSAEKLGLPENSGHARVEIVAKDEKTGRVIAQLRELGIGHKALSCGILVSSNKDVREWADVLRSEGFQVVEEGAREPGKDHPVGVMIWQLLRWLADPSDSFAKQAVMMSPLKVVLEGRFGISWQAIWEKLGGLASEKGFAGMMREIVSPLEEAWEEFGKHRAEDLMQALEELDQSGVVLAREAADWIGRMKISQSPGVAAIQVMTIHKSKGLGFDVVILPDISGDKIPSLKHFNTVFGDGWIADAPASWVRAMIPELKNAEEKWSRQQTYEAFCKLYVALTRAKRGLYVFLDEPSKSADSEKPSFANWVMGSLEMEGTAEEVFEIGDANWQENVPVVEGMAKLVSKSLGQAVAKRSRTTPSSGKDTIAGTPGRGDSGRRFGIEMHRAFERVGWLDEDELPEFSNEIANVLTATLDVPEVRDLFSKKGREIHLHREQRIEAVADGKWMSGVIDRLHVHIDQKGKANLVEIIDFKTDRVDSPKDLQERYSTQMIAYSKAMQAVYPDAEIRCLLVSTALAAIA